MVDGVTGWEGTPAQVLRRRPEFELELELESGEDPAELIGYLESDQLSQERSQPVPRARLSGRRRGMLWALRLFGLALSGMVLYTFASQLAG